MILGSHSHRTNKIFNSGYQFPGQEQESQMDRRINLMSPDHTIAVEGWPGIDMAFCTNIRIVIKPKRTPEDSVPSLSWP
jgi:hypothetical protein